MLKFTGGAEWSTDLTLQPQIMGSSMGCKKGKQGLGDEWPESLESLKLEIKRTRCASWKVLSVTLWRLGMADRLKWRQSVECHCNQLSEIRWI